MRLTFLLACGALIAFAPPGRTADPPGIAKAPGSTDRWVCGFEGETSGPLPEGFITETTNPRGPEAVWQVVDDPASPERGRILALTCAREGVGSMYNLCWTRSVSFRDGTVEVKVKARGGEEDQGGGPIWRARDRNHYYLARWNPLEDNFRIYSVKNGRRIQIAGAPVADDDAAWHTLRIEHHGDTIRGFFDGAKLLEVKDSTFSREGGVGVWTRSDAETSFDDLTVIPVRKPPGDGGP